MTDPVKYLVTVTEHALLVELRVPIPVPDLTTFAVEHRAQLTNAFTGAALLVQAERDRLLAERSHAG